jgi:hypothetical protein
MTQIVLAKTPLYPVEQVTEFVNSDAFSYRREHLWAGPSGDIVTGTEIAAHLEATLALLESKGWVRNYGPSDDEADDVDESASVRDMLRKILRLLSWSRPGYTLGLALYEVGTSDIGDSDTLRVAERCLNVVLASQSPTGDSSYYAWSSRRGRTFDEVRGLLVTGAEFACRYGPKGGE